MPGVALVLTPTNQARLPKADGSRFETSHQDQERGMLTQGVLNFWDFVPYSLVIP